MLMQRNRLIEIKKLLELPRREIFVGEPAYGGLDGLACWGIVNGEPDHITSFYNASKKIKPFDVSLRNLGFDARIFAIGGELRIHHAIPIHRELTYGKSIGIDRWHYDPNGGSEFENRGSRSMCLTETVLPPGSCTFLNAGDVFSLSCSKDTQWVIDALEKPRVHRFVYGYPHLPETGYLDGEVDRVLHTNILLSKLTNLIEPLGKDYAY